MMRGLFGRRDSAANSDANLGDSRARFTLCPLPYMLLDQLDCGLARIFRTPGVNRASHSCIMSGLCTLGEGSPMLASRDLNTLYP